MCGSVSCTRNIEGCAPYMGNVTTDGRDTTPSSSSNPSGGCCLLQWALTGQLHACSIHMCLYAGETTAALKASYEAGLQCLHSMNVRAAPTRTTAPLW